MNVHFTKRTEWLFVTTLVVAALIIVGCGTHYGAGKVDVGKRQPTGEAPKIGPEGVPADWIGFELGLKAPTFEPAQRAEVAAEIGGHLEDVRTMGVRAPSATSANESPTPKPGADDSIALMSINARTGEAFTTTWNAVAADRILRAVAAVGQPGTLAGDETAAQSLEPRPPRVRGLPRASDSPGNIVHAAWPPPDLAKPRLASWSDGEQSFVRLGIADGYGSNHKAFRSIGQIGSGCSGVLIGPRHVLTAAHCVVDRVNGVAYSASFRPRRDWSEGTASPTEAYGSRTFVHYYFPVAYWDGVSCTNAWTCNQFDIALGILSSDAGVPAMGHWYAPISTLDTWSKYNRGYPRCFGTEPDAEAPRPDPPCQRSTLFGDAQLCEIGDWKSPGPDGYNRELFVNCDGARGMSGSPMYRYNDDGNPVALGVYSHFICTAEACADNSGGDYPNVMTRVTPESAGWIAAAKSLWSCPSGSCAPNP